MPPPPRMPTRLAPAIAALGALLFFAVLATRELADFDLPWHLAYGRAIALTRSVPRVDDFAYTHTFIRYVGVVADAALYGVYAAGGELGLQLAGAAMGVALAALLYLRARAYGPLGVAAVALAMTAVSPWLLVRPATLSFLFLAAELALIDAHRKNPERSRALLALPVVQALWSNCHGAGTLGAGIIATYAAHRGLAKAIGPRFPRLFGERDGECSERTAAVAAVAITATALNPFGISYFLGGPRVMAYARLVTEWAPTSPDFFTRSAPATAAFLVIALASFALGREPETHERTPNLWDTLMVALACVLATRVRLLPFSILLLAPLLARRARAVVPHTVLLARVLPLTAVLAAPLALMIDDTPRGVGFDPRHFPEPAVRFIQRAQPTGHVWNFPPFGGYLTLRLYPALRILMDGRIGFVHDLDTAVRVHASDTDPQAFAKLVADFEIEWAICRAREGESFCIPVANDSEWALVFWDDVSAIYVRRAGPNAALAARGYRTLRHLTPPAEVLAAAVRSQLGGLALVRDATLAVDQAPSSPRAWFIEACAGIASRDESRFRRAVGRLAVLAPGNPSIAAAEEGWAAVSHSVVH